MKTVSILIVLSCVFLLVACGPKNGDVLLAKGDVRLIEDWNAPSVIKSVACTLVNNEQVEVLDTASLFCGSDCSEQVIQVSSMEREGCKGWAFPRNFDK